MDFKLTVLRREAKAWRKISPRRAHGHLAASGNRRGISGSKRPRAPLAGGADARAVVVYATEVPPTDAPVALRRRANESEFMSMVNRGTMVMGQRPCGRSSCAITQTRSARIGVPIDDGDRAWGVGAEGAS